MIEARIYERISAPSSLISKSKPPLHQHFYYVTMGAKNVLVTGANGFIGNAVCQSICQAQLDNLGLVRKPEALSLLAVDEFIPILGSPADLSSLDSLQVEKRTFNVIVTLTEQIRDYIPRHNDVVSLSCAIAETSNDFGVRPLVLFTFGCKDYGMTGLARSDGL